MPLPRILLAALALFPLGLAAAPPTPVIVAEVRLGRFEDRVEALGTLRANEMVELTANVTETITAIHFDDGQRVKAGDILVEMTSAEEHALLEEAQATVDEARSQYERVKSLAGQGTAAQSLLDERRREWDTARARLTAIESRLADRLVRAPFDGVLGLRNVSLGALVKPGDVITTLDDDSRMKLEFPVPSPFLATLRPGLAIVARARAYADREFRGEVSSVDSRVDPATRSVRVRALLPNPDRTLRPGILMSVVLLKDPRDALVVPESALVPLGQQVFVFRAVESDGNRVERREVRVGARRPGEVEVLEGLAPGDRVVTHGTLRLKDGDPVAVRAVDDGRSRLPELLEAGSTGIPSR
jgi:membrane fusion protein (multidrug efflux system)